MRLKADFRTLPTRRVPTNPVYANTTEKNERLREQQKMAQRLYNNIPLMSNRWWETYSSGYPARATAGPTAYGLQVFESGEIELRSPCGGSPSARGIRYMMQQATNNTIENGANGR